MTGIIAPLLALALLPLAVMIDLRSTDGTCGVPALTARRPGGRSVTMWAVLPHTAHAEPLAGDDAAWFDQVVDAVTNDSPGPALVRAGCVSANRTCILPQRGWSCEAVQRSVDPAGRRTTALPCARDLARVLETRRTCGRTPRCGRN